MKNIAILLIFSVVGSIMLYVSAQSYWSTRDFIAHAVNADGKLVGVVAANKGALIGTDRSKIAFVPKVSFVASDGKKYVFVSKTSGFSNYYSAGDIIPVLYEPGNPVNARINQFSYLWMGPLIFGAFGVAFTGGGLAALFVLRRW